MSPSAPPQTTARRLFGLRSPSDAMLHLDLLRFVAASGIVATHSRALLVSGAEREALLANPGTLFMFVELFFVISGYVISSVYGERVRTLGGYAEFMQRRIARLYPLHLFAMFVFMALVGAATLAGFEMATQFSWKPACIVTGALLLQSVIDCGGLIFNTQSWSISVEMVLYTLFPVVALLQRRVPAWLLMLVALAGVAVHASGATVGPRHPLLMGFIWFVLGVALHRCRPAIQRLRLPSWAALACILALIVEMVTLGDVAVTSLLIVLAVTVSIAADGHAPSAPVARLAPLGELTYGIYMLHGIVILALLNGLGDKVLHLTGLPMLALAALTYAIIFVASLASYHWLETPARRRLGAPSRRCRLADLPTPP